VAENGDGVLDMKPLNGIPDILGPEWELSTIRSIPPGLHIIIGSGTFSTNKIWFKDGL
jgi:hypothetical protein